MSVSQAILNGNIGRQSYILLENISENMDSFRNFYRYIFILITARELLPMAHLLMNWNQQQKFSFIIRREWLKIGRNHLLKKPCYVLYSPAVFYRRKNKIEKLNQAEGTIAFPAHTTPSIEDVSNIEIYIEQLKNLPAQFQPVSVCLHMHDINKGQHKIFMKHNIPVYTAGNSADPRFIERFHDILKNFKYSTSNMIGSYAYYSVEMGIPFSVYGNPQKFINNDDPNITKGEWNPYNEYEYYRKVYELFNDLNTEISVEQKDLVEKELGIYDGLSRFDMAKVLYKIYFKRGDLIKDFIDYLFNFLKEFRVKTRSFRRKFKFGNSKKTNS